MRLESSQSKKKNKKRSNRPKKFKAATMMTNFEFQAYFTACELFVRDKNIQLGTRRRKGKKSIQKRVRNCLFL